jgi:serine/threonine protein kinase
MVAVKRIGLEGLKEEEISQLMREVDLVKRLSHPSIVKYEGMARDENTLSIVLECVIPSSFYMPLPCLPSAAHSIFYFGTY